MTIWVWRHPAACGAAGRCIGRTDLPVDPRRAKRLAHRIRAQARRHGLPHRVVSSPLQRCAAVGQWLRRWGWQHTVLHELQEMDFGQWEGRPWAAIAQAEVDLWCAHFLHHRPGGGESLHTFFARVAAWVPTHTHTHTHMPMPMPTPTPTPSKSTSPPATATATATAMATATATATPGPVLVVGHAGWMLARRWLSEGSPWPTRAAQWPAAPRHGTLWKITP